MDESTLRRRRGIGFVTPNACVECRKRKAKCDGRMPCTRCISQDVAECSYDIPVRQSKEAMRLEIKRLRDNQRHSKRVLDALVLNDTAVDILGQLRNGEALEDISRRLESASVSPASNPVSYDSLKHSGESTPTTSRPNASNSPSVFGDWHKHTPIQGRGEWAIDYGQQMLLGDQKDSYGLLSHHGPKHNNQSWTRVTNDVALVEHLLALYFCWEYPIFATVSKEHFMEDYRKGLWRYCSPLLVNAILSLACRFSDRPQMLCNPGDGTTAGDAFFAEAWRLMNADTDHHELTTVQALGVMSIREASCGRITRSSFLSGQSIRLAVEMSLHQDIIYGGDEDGDAEKAVYEATFWGALSLNEMLSLCTGSLPHLSKHIKLPAKPAIIQHIEEALWVPYTDDGAPLDQHFSQPSNLRTVYKTFCDLSERVHQALYTLYSPGSEVTAVALIDIYNGYIHWYDTIPESLRLGQNFTPAVLFAHLFYHSATLLLFQPFINLKINTSSVLPQDICNQAADAITGLVRSYSDLYSLRLTPSFVPYFVLVSAIIHLVTVKTDPSDPNVRGKLLQSISDLEEMTRCHAFAFRAIDALRYLTHHWGVQVSFNGYGEYLRDVTSSSSASPDQFSPDIGILQLLQRIQPVLSSNDHPLFSPFPMQGLPSVALGAQMEQGGFTLASRG
ncbi:fungal-specific transcription factor domain-containing protein [Leptodontidium sp. 2 PMI_412]|nr:fungal-specific transcription factor domain-containing protein [Leptodontidium sp. 2 PMI_412]